MTGNGLKDIQSATCAVGRAISIRPDMEEIRTAVARASLRQPQEVPV
jgi:hypothetical protein